MELETAIDKVWSFHGMNHQPEASDAILALGSHDTRVAERAADLWLQDMGKWLIFSGGLGRLTEDLWKTSEAELFRDIALEKGVPDDKILVENRSTNTGENFRFTEKIIRDRGLFDLQTFIVVQKPYMERRAYATFKKHWPTKTCRVTSPELSFEEYCLSPNPEINRDQVIHLMVGDLQRLWVYADLGFQVAMPVPESVMEAYQTLVAAGFTQHLVQ